MTTTNTPTSGAADLRATFSEMLVDLPNTEPFTLFKAGFDAALAAGQATAAQQPAPSPAPASDDCFWNPLPCVHCEQPQGEHFIGRCYGVSGETVYTPHPTPTAQADNKKKDLL